VEIKKAEFLTSWVGDGDPPDWNLPEVVVAGRSNVGKSSFINAILKRRSLAHTSSQPGKTRCINYFKVNEEFVLVDLPGYGYARTSESERDKWAVFINKYLQNSKDICLVICIIDAKVGITPLDSAMLEFLARYGYPYYAVFNKVDKLNTTQKRDKINEWNAHELITGYQVFSATKKIGLEELYSILDLYVKEDECLQ